MIKAIRGFCGKRPAVETKPVNKQYELDNKVTTIVARITITEKKELTKQEESEECKDAVHVEVLILRDKIDIFRQNLREEKKILDRENRREHRNYEYRRH